jgi:hypothetical protein
MDKEIFKQTMVRVLRCSSLSFRNCFSSDSQCRYSCINDSICSLSTHTIVSATWSSGVMFRTARQHTVFYCNVFCREDIVPANFNHIVARRHQAKPNLIVNLKRVLKHPGNPTLQFCNPSNTCDGFPRTLSWCIFHSPMPLALRMCKVIDRVCTYVATCVEHEVCVFWFSQICWAVG